MKKKSRAVTDRAGKVVEVPASEEIERAGRRGGVLISAITVWEIAMESTRLPGSVHGDAADRVLAASWQVTALDMTP